MTRIFIYDTTLRDGSQGEGVTFSLQDKLRITQRLDDLGVDFIEGGYPLSNPKDFEYFQQVRLLPLRHARVAAFGMTRRKNTSPAEDTCLKALLDAQTPLVTIVGKTWDLHVSEVLGTSLEENLRMIGDSVACCKQAGREVFYDAEHYFDGFKRNPEYALQTLRAAQEAGATFLILCDTNGGTLPDELADIVERTRRQLRVELGIHCHNDCDVAVANSLAAVAKGVTQVQGTINGIGERCGNADLVSIIANLVLKMRPSREGEAPAEPVAFGSAGASPSRGKPSREGEASAEPMQKPARQGLAGPATPGGYEVLQPDSLPRLTEVSRYVYETANMNFRNNQPFVGTSAFAHKGGMHTHAVARLASTYEHIDPATVGNERRILVSELSGQSTILTKTSKYALTQDRALMQKILKQVQDLENEGYEFEAAEASFDLLVQKAAGLYRPWFERLAYRVNIETGLDAQPLTEATIKIQVGGQEMHTVSEGDGPVNALYSAMGKALQPSYPRLEEMHLVDYKVRVVNARAETAARVRVVVTWKDGSDVWTTVGVSENIIEASWLALTDAVEFKLFLDQKNKG